MEFQKVLETRRTVRKYSAGVTREQMEELLRAAQEAPSWKNSQTGRYYCVLSEEIVNKIRENCLPGARNAEKSEHAALIVIYSADPADSLSVSVPKSSCR